MTDITQLPFFAKGKKELPHKIGVSLKVGQGTNFSKDISCSFGSVFFWSCSGDPAWPDEGSFWRQTVELCDRRRLRRRQSYIHCSGLFLAGGCLLVCIAYLWGLCLDIYEEKFQMAGGYISVDVSLIPS